MQSAASLAVGFLLSVVSNPISTLILLHDSITLVLKTTSFIVLLPGETAPTISSYDFFVFRSVLGVYSLMPTSLRFLFINF